jgi:hypothetical protein
MTVTGLASRKLLLRTVQVHNRAGALGALHLQRMHGHETLSYSYILVRGLFRPLGPAAAAVRHGHTHARHTPHRV